MIKKSIDEWILRNKKTRKKRIAPAKMDYNISSKDFNRALLENEIVAGYYLVPKVEKQTNELDLVFE